jgi:hypothetical protein
VCWCKGSGALLLLLLLPLLLYRALWCRDVYCLNRPTVVTGCTCIDALYLIAGGGQPVWPGCQQSGHF